MTAAKAKGTAWETALARTLGAFFAERFGLKPRRVAQEGFADTGDLHGISPFIAQAKNYRSWEDAIRVGLDGAEVQRVRAREHYGVAFVKRVRRSVGEGYAVMTVATWARLVLRLRRAETYLQEADPARHADHVAQTLVEVEEPFPRV